MHYIENTLRLNLYRIFVNSNIIEIGLVTYQELVRGYIITIIF